jgi:hypothetical protein
LRFVGLIRDLVSSRRVEQSGRGVIVLASSRRSFATASNYGRGLRAFFHVEEKRSAVAPRGREQRARKLRCEAVIDRFGNCCGAIQKRKAALGSPRSARATARLLSVTTSPTASIARIMVRAISL